jgi:hypothetical protein
MRFLSQLHYISGQLVYRHQCYVGFQTSAAVYKACSEKDRTFVINISFYNILSTVPFKVVPSIGDTLFPTFLPLLECFLERSFCEGAQFSYRIFLNLRVFKKRMNYLNSSPTSIEGVLRLLSAPSGRF